LILTGERKYYAAKLAGILHGRTRSDKKAVAKESPAHHQMNPIKKTIGWADYSWNPVIGCRRNCFYCYARRKFKRFHKKNWPLNHGKFETLALYPRRFDDKDLRKPGPFKVFVGDMTDLEYWHPEWTIEVLSCCELHDQHTFMFLSKDISAYTNAPDWPVWPENTMQGITFVRIDGKEYTDLSRMRLWQRPYI
jgi:protein gp37